MDDGYMRTKKVSVVVLNYNTHKDTIRCLKSLNRMDYPNFEVILIDNGSTLDNFRMLKEAVSVLVLKFGLKLVRVGENLSFTGGF